MSINDPIADMLTRIRNGLMRQKTSVSTPGSRLRRLVLDVLVAEGYIRGYTTTEFDGGMSQIDIELKYHDGRPVIREIQRISRPGRRVYTSVANLKPVADGLGVSIVSTPKGVLADWQARELSVGGEVLCQVF